jgi:hypothetical protein
MGTQYGKRPSELIGIFDSHEAFDFDSAVFLIARFLEREKDSDSVEPVKKSKETFSQQMNKLRMIKAQADNLRRGN